MLTGTKLIGGMLLALTSLCLSYLFIEASPPGTVGNTVYTISGVIGFILGWRAIGFNPGFGGIHSITSGLVGATLLIFFSGISFGVWVVILKLKEHQIKKIENLLSVTIDGAMRYYEAIFDPTILATVALGGSIAGIAAGISNRIAR